MIVLFSTQKEDDLVLRRSNPFNCSKISCDSFVPFGQMFPSVIVSVTMGTEVTRALPILNHRYSGDSNQLPFKKTKLFCKH